jgi:hypothetical protein
MSFRRRITAIGVGATVAAWCALGGSALAAFPNFTGCPTGLPTNSACIDVQSQSGEIIIKGFHVPLDHSLEIRGAIRSTDASFVPATGTNGFIAQPVNVPGGLLGIELPIELNLITATAELAGPSSSIVVNPSNLSISLPMKVRLSNPLIGSGCYIGTDRAPVRVNLITGTTSPPSPNRPISGHFGESSASEGVIFFRGNLNVENSFSVPGASGCGFLGILNPLINLKLKLPSAAGNNTISVENDVALTLAR